MIDQKNLPNVAPEMSLEELFEAGSHFGHQAKKWHPKMAEWIYEEKDGVHIFDLAKTAAQLQAAYNFAYQLGVNKKNLVVVCTKKQAAEMVETAATEAGAMYVVHRWLGGLVTNWDQVGKSVKRMNEIEKGLATNKYADLTKYERTMLAKELERLERFFGGLKNLKGLPDAAFIIDVQKEKNAVKELTGENIPTMALVDSNSDPSGIDIVIPANDDALSSIKLIVDTVLAGYAAGVQGKKLAAEAATEVKEEVKAEAKPAAEKVEEKEVAKPAKAEAKTDEAAPADKPVKKAPAKKAAAKTETKTETKKAPAKKPAAKKTTAKKEAAK